MRSSDILTAAVAALGTMAVVLALAMPAHVDAGPNRDLRSPEILRPELKIGDTTLTLQAAKPNYEPGQEPALELAARNAGKAPAEIRATVSMSDQDPVSALSRVAVVPKPAFSKEFIVALGPGESKSIAIPTGKPVAAGHTIAFVLWTDAQHQVWVPGVTVPGGPPLAGLRGPGRLAASATQPATQPAARQIAAATKR